MSKRQFSLATVAGALPLAVILSTGIAIAAPPGTIGPVPLTTREVAELTSFSSPSGNIGCYIEPTNVRCDIAERNWSPPSKPTSCPEVVSWGQGLELTVGRPAGFVCAGDTALTNGSPLAYGDKIVSGSIECTSLPDGISCWDFVYGGEFTISRENYDIQ
jgi:hypothetical protein